MNVVLLGPPGAGKGTQAEKLAERYGMVHIATGDMFRAALSKGTPMGVEAKRYMDAGILAPDEVVVGMVAERLSEPDTSNGFMLDGFPRNTLQAEALDQILASSGRSIDLVVNIVVAGEMLISRLTGRRVCRGCGANFHTEYSSPKTEGECDACGGVLYQRDDDNEKTVKSRLEVYLEQTKPVIEYYRSHANFIDIDGQDSPAVVFENIVSAISGIEVRNR